MALPTRPLAIKDACGTTRSIAREVDGNVTGDKSLNTLGVTAGLSAGGTFMSEFEGFSSGIDLCVCTYSTIGSAFTPSHCKFSCFTYNPAMAAGQTWCACICWKAYAGSGGGRGCQCVFVRCNGITTMNCYVTQFSVGYTNCFGTTSVGPIDNNDTVCMVTCSTGVCILGYGYASGQMFVYESFANVNGNVNLQTLGTRCVCTYAIQS